MRKLFLTLNLTPAPAFLLGFIWSLLNPSHVCGHDYSMPVMWFVMFVAHLAPWAMYLQQRYLSRNA
jgi:hypothetical protein